MTAILNYLIEANLGLLFFYACYWLLLRGHNVCVSGIQCPYTRIPV